MVAPVFKDILKKTISKSLVALLIFHAFCLLNSLKCYSCAETVFFRIIKELKISRFFSN